MLGCVQLAAGPVGRFGLGVLLSFTRTNYTRLTRPQVYSDCPSFPDFPRIAIAFLGTF